MQNSLTWIFWLTFYIKINYISIPHNCISFHFLYTIIMNTSSLRRSYIFNFLCVCEMFFGLLVVIFFAVALIAKIPPILFFLFFHKLGILNLIILLFSVLIYMCEFVFAIKINNLRFLNSKKILILQNIGIATFLLIVLFDLIFFGSEYLKVIIYNLNLSD